MNLKQLQQKTIAVESKFPYQLEKAPLALDMVEEVGELAQAILIVEKLKLTNDPKKQRSIEDIANALGDIMFDLLVLAEKYGLDMEVEYIKVVEELEGRVKQGEFNKV